MTSGKDSQNYSKEIEQSFLRKLEEGIEDMEAGRVLPIDEAFQKITELRKNRRNSRQKQKNR